MSEGYQPNGPATNEVTPPNLGSCVQEAPRRRILKCMEDIEASINSYVNDIDPCPMCANKTEKGYGEPCSICAYFYAGQFKTRKAQ